MVPAQPMPTEPMNALIAIDSNKVFHAPGPRPIVIVKDGNVVKELLT